jgi:hypothetical protein
MEKTMAHVVSPFLEEIIQFLDLTVCEDHSEFAKLHYDFRVFAALLNLLEAGLAKSKTRPGRGASWTPTKKLLGLLGNPPKKPDFPSLVIADYDETMPDEVAQSGLDYAQAFADLLRESWPMMETFRAGFHSYEAGLVDWRRGPDGTLKWLVTQRGENLLMSSGSITGSVN